MVRLHHTLAFQSADRWRSAAGFKTQTGTKLGFTLTQKAEGSSTARSSSRTTKAVPPGKRLYLQLKSGDSLLTKRQRDGAEVIQI